MDKLYDKLGGQATLDKVVQDFHKRILADNTLQPFFANTDMEKQRQHQVAFFSQIFEGPNQYSGRTMEKTHAGMNLQQSHFDAIVSHLKESMASVGASTEDTNAAVARVDKLKGAILNK
ncbi:group 1 truncated hemoglobin [Hassallia byssoidea VB512170]|uniref:Group 1 truncated hemoglobin n=1 Tax=Hassallia byssoidea VB512170 TaxID=1304833 RepID=A0A846H547_9CYAN|nr:group 1 truncated hemoglobin [Hassalia byssoidea]NEU72737.1 group 1 truncated hemoglobin [Hassalia byssoidea VB512170]